MVPTVERRTSRTVGCVLLAAWLLPGALTAAATGSALLNSFEAESLGEIRADNRGMEHPVEVEFCRVPEFVREGRQSLRFAIDMRRKGTYSYCLLWMPFPGPPPMPAPAVSAWVRGTKGALLGRFRFYVGGSPAFTSEDVRFSVGDWRRVVLREWKPAAGVTAEVWRQVNGFAFIVVNGSDAEAYFDDMRFVDADALPAEARKREDPGDLLRRSDGRVAGTAIHYVPVPGLQKLVFRVPESATFGPQALPALRLDVGITPRGQGGPSLQRRLTGFSVEDRQQEVGTSELTPGDYTLRFAVWHGEQQLAAHETGLAIPPSPPWQGQHIGREALDPDHVPPPWTPLQVDGSAVSVWGRELLLSDLALPEQIRAAGETLLAAPVSLHLEGADGKPALVQGNGPDTIARHRGVCGFSGSGASGPFRAAVTTRIEYDGLTTVRLTVEAASPSDLRSATLLFPLRADAATAFHYQPYLASGGIIPYGGKKIDDIYKEQPGSGWLPRGTGTVWQRPYCPLLWLGNPERGLSFFVESEEGFHPQDPDDRDSRVEIRRQGDRVVLALRLVTKPLRVERPLHYRFGFVPTPVKPFPEGWRSWRMTARRTKVPTELYPPGTGNLHVYWQQFTRKYGVLDSELARPDLFTAAAARDDAAGRAVVPYYAPQWIIAGVYDPVAGAWDRRNPLLEHYLTEWHADRPRTIDYPTQPPKVTRTYSASISDNSWPEYLLWLMREQARRGADGYYSDCAGPTPDSNAAYDCGYTGLDGKRYPTFNLRPKRDLLKRALAMYRQVRGERRKLLTGLGIMHGSGVSPTLVPFFDVRLDGEFERSRLVDLVKRRPDVAPFFYSNLYTLEEFRIQYGGKKFGTPVAFLPELKWVSDTTDLLPEETMLTPEATRDFLVMTLLTDTLVWPLWCNAGEVYKTWAVKDRFGIGAADVRFLPYWAAEDAIRSDRDDVKVTAYIRPGGRVLAVVGNLAEDERSTRLTVVPGDLGVRADSEWVDGISGEHFAARGDVLDVVLPPRDFRMLVTGPDEP